MNSLQNDESSDVGSHIMLAGYVLETRLKVLCTDGMTVSFAKQWPWLRSAYWALISTFDDAALRGRLKRILSLSEKSLTVPLNT